MGGSSAIASGAPASFLAAGGSASNNAGGVAAFSDAISSERGKIQSALLASGGYASFLPEIDEQAYVVLDRDDASSSEPETGQFAAKQPDAGASQTSAELSAPGEGAYERGWFDAVLDVLGVVGGAAEIAAGGAIGAAGVVTTAAGGWIIGVPVAGFGAVVAAHGMDTAETSIGRLITGADLDTDSSKLLQAAGMERREANLTDAGVGIVFSLGAAGLTKSGVVAKGLTAGNAAALRNADRTRRIAQETFNREAGGVIGVAIMRPAGHMKVGVQTVGEDGRLWSHLQNFQAGSPIKIRYTREPLEKNYWVMEIPVSAEQAERAASRIEQIVQSQMVGGTRDYVYGRSDCMEYVADVLRSAGIEAPMSNEALELLDIVQREAVPLIDTAISNRRLAAASTDFYEAMALADAADDSLAAAVPIAQQYVANRSMGIYLSVLDQSGDLARNAHAHLATLRQASTAYDQTAALADAARALNNGIADRAATQALFSGGTYAARGIDELFPEETDAALPSPPANITETPLGQDDAPAAP